jgi:hypothetical protein
MWNSCARGMADGSEFSPVVICVESNEISSRNPWAQYSLESPTQSSNVRQGDQNLCLVNLIGPTMSERGCFVRTQPIQHNSPSRVTRTMTISSTTQKQWTVVWGLSGTSDSYAGIISGCFSMVPVVYCSTVVRMVSYSTPVPHRKQRTTSTFLRYAGLHVVYSTSLHTLFSGTQIMPIFMYQLTRHLRQTSLTPPCRRYNDYTPTPKKAHPKP